MALTETSEHSLREQCEILDRQRERFDEVLNELRGDLEHRRTVTSGEVLSWLKRNGYKPREIKQQFPGDPEFEFRREDDPLAYSVQSTHSIDVRSRKGFVQGPEFAILRAHTKDAERPCSYFLAHYPLNFGNPWLN